MITDETTTQPTEPVATKTFIRLDNLTKTYQSAAGEFQILKGINLSITQGQFVGLVGPSGSGKSTLLNLLTGIDKPTTGTVEIDGQQIEKLSENRLAKWRGRSVGIVFQFFQLLPTLAVIENVMMPMDFGKYLKPKARKERALELLELVGVADHANKLPAALSGGQQQRVAIARALANDPGFIIGDEPTGNLDSKTAVEVFELLTRLNAQGKTILMVTHDDKLAEQMPRRIRIQDGLLVGDSQEQSL
jgi:ABC-type lipoprotein export system ATPase subunit